MKICVATVLIVIRLVHSNKIDCNNWNQCQFHRIESNQILCSSYIGCQSATITSKGADSAIECTGSHSCNQATSLKATGDIFCAGDRSCYSVTPIESANLKCSGSYSCYCDGLKVVSLLSNEEISCGGYRSCENCKISAGKKTYCDGAISCKNNAISTQDNILCRGMKSCESATLTTLTDVDCDGDSSCNKARIKSKRTSLKGNKSGKDAKINSEEVEATGIKSLDGAEMESKGRAKMRVKLSGKSATTDTSVVCVDESECDVQCTDECPELEVISMSGTILYVTVTTTVEDPNTGIITTTTIECITSDTNGGCPTIMSSNSDCIDETYRNYLIEKRNKIQLKRLSEEAKGYIENIEETYNIIPKVSKSVIKADINVCVYAYDCQGQTLEEPHQECYGYMSCESAYINQMIDTKTYSGSVGYIECYGDSSCKNSHIHTNKGCIYCAGADSCKFATKLEGAEIQCSGLSSCAYVNNIINTNDISCEARSSCIGNSMNIVSNTNCIAKSACLYSNIISGNRIQCDGITACAQGNLHSPIIKCSSQQSCYNSSIIADSKLYIDGAEAAAYTYITNTPYIIAYGYKSFSHSTIDSNNIPFLNIYAFGDLSGFASIIVCKSGSTCKIECESNGCRNLDLICEVGSTCLTQPSRCMKKKKSGTTIKGIYCPNIEIKSEETEKLLLKSGLNNTEINNIK
eukprot:28137_1